MKRHFIKPAPLVVGPQFVNVAAKAFAVNGPSVTLNLPTGRVNGNVLIAMVQFGNNRAPPVTWSSGWTLILNTDGSTSNDLSCAWRFVTGSEAAPTASASSNTTYMGTVAQYSGCNATAPIGSKAGIVSSGAGVVNFTPLQANSLLLAIQGVQGANIPISAPTGYNLRQQDTQASEPSLSLADITNPFGTSAGSYTTTAGAGFQWGQSIELIA